MMRPAVTAAGVASAAGVGFESFACALYSGKCVDSDGRRVARIPDFNPQQWLGNKGIRVMDRSARFLAVAGAMGLADSEICTSPSQATPPEVGLACGSVFGSLHSIASFDWSGLIESPNLV